MATVYAQAQEDSTHVYKSIFGEDSTQWNELRIDHDCQSIGFHTYRFKANHAFDSVGDDGATYCLIDFASNPYRIMGEYIWIRLVESEKHDRVYLQYLPAYLDSSIHELLVMDLNLQEGDTFLIRRIRYDYAHLDSIYDSIPVVVDSVYYEDSVKHIRFDSVWRCYYSGFYSDLQIVPLEFIEGLGTSFGCFYQTIDRWYNYDYELNNIMQCCFHDGEKVYGCTWFPYYSWFTDSCFVDIYFDGGAVSETGKEYYTLFPNPHDGGTSLYNPEGRFIKLEVYDMSGRRMLTAESSETSIPIEMTSWPAGVYLIRIEENGQVSYLKSVKQ